MKTLNNYRGIFVVPILSLIFEKLLKNRVTPCLEQNMTPFQTGGVKGKGITDNLFILGLLIILNIFKRRYGLPFMTLRSVLIVCGWRTVLTHCMKMELKMIFLI